MVKGKKQAVKEKKDENSEQIENLKKQVARTLADYDNLRKRVETEKSVWEKVAASKVVLRLLPVFDMLTDAQKHINDSGLEIVIGEFKKSIFELGIEEVSANPGDAFDPEVHEAIEMVPGEKENVISEIVQSGWKIREESYIIRPAKVKVYKINN